LCSIVVKVTVTVPFLCVCIPPAKAVPEMVYTVSGGTLNPTHSLICSPLALLVMTAGHPICKNFSLKQVWKVSLFISYLFTFFFLILVSFISVIFRIFKVLHLTVPRYLYFQHLSFRFSLKTFKFFLVYALD